MYKNTFKIIIWLKFLKYLYIYKNYFYRVPRPPEMAELLDRLLSTQDRLRPYVERYRTLMLEDPTLTPGVCKEMYLTKYKYMSSC